jgi:hypothetical protein
MAILNVEIKTLLRIILFVCNLYALRQRGIHNEEKKDDREKSF